MQTLNLGAQIAHYRKQLGLTQEALAGQLGVTNQAVSKWEANQSCPDVQLLPELADLFGISLDRLFGRTEAVTPVIDQMPWDDDGALRAVLYLGRQLQQNTPLEHRKENQLVEFHWDGPAINVYSDFSVVCENCQIDGSVHAGTSVTCGDVGRNVDAGDDVYCGSVGGNVTAGDSVSCGNVAKNVTAGDSVSCGNVGGSIHTSS